MRPEHLIFAAPLALLLGACTDSAPDAGADLAPAPVARSARGNLRFKGPERLATDFSAALELPKEKLCNELGLYACTTLVHNVALGGVNPYGTGLYEAPGVTAVTTPLVVERVAWSACTQRVDADLAAPGSAVVFRGVPIQGGRLASPDGDEVRGAIAQLTQRALQRDPSPAEVARYVQLARDVHATSDPKPARAALQALCFAVLSSAEAVFY